MLAVTVSLLLAVSSISVAFCQLLDEDSRTSTYSKCSILLSKQDDAIATTDFYDLKVIVASRIEVEDLLPNPEWSGPIITNVYVYLPSYASEIRALPSQSTSLTVYQQQGLRFEPEIEKSGSFVRVYWKLSTERFGLAKRWSFIDYVDYSLSFIVPEDASVIAYAYVQTVFYSYRGVYYSQLADEKVYWLEVKNTNETIAQPQAVENDVPTLLLDTLGVDLIMAAVFSVAAFWHFKHYRRMSPIETAMNEQRALKTHDSGRGAGTLGITTLAVAVAFLGFLEILTGLSQLGWYPSVAINLLAYGLASIVIAVGLFQVKPWAWYAAVSLTIISIIDHYLLFPAFAVFTIPLEPFILIYLLLRRKRFLL